MRKLIVITGALALLVMAASADARGRGGQGFYRQSGCGGIERQAQLQRDLNLSQEQISQIQEIRRSGGTREEMHAVLSETQRAILGECRGQDGAQRNRAGQGRQGRGRLQAQRPPADAANG